MLATTCHSELKLCLLYGKPLARASRRASSASRARSARCRAMRESSSAASSGILPTCEGYEYSNRKSSVSSETARAPLLAAVADAVALGVGLGVALGVASGAGPRPGHADTAAAITRTAITRLIGPAFPKRARTGKRQSMSKHDLIQPDRGQQAIAIHLVNKDGFGEFAKTLSAQQRAALAGQKFTGGGYQVGVVPDGDSWFAVGGVKNPVALSSWCLAKLAEALPEGTYR